MFELKGKVAFVTGAASGLGFAFSKQLLRNDLKAVALVDIDEDNGQHAIKELRQEFGGERAIFVKADVSDENQLKKAFDATVECYKQLDIIVNNAGVLGEINYERLLQINLVSVMRGTLMAIRDYFPKYKSSSDALVVNISSIGGLYPAHDDPIYTASKSGMIGFTRAMGGEQNCQETNVKVIVICPGPVDTPMLRRYIKNSTNSVEISMAGCGKVTLNLQRPEEVAQIAMDIMRKASSGSVWTINESRCNQVELLVNEK